MEMHEEKINIIMKYEALIIYGIIFAV